MNDLHPFLVHFPVALLTVALFFEAAGILLKRDDFARTAWWTQVVGTLGAYAAILSGLMAEKTLKVNGALKEVLEMHKQLAFLIAAVFSVLALWRIGTRGALPVRNRVLYLAAFLTGAVLLWIGAWYGGELVFRYGAGSQPVP